MNDVVCVRSVYLISRVRASCAFDDDDEEEEEEEEEEEKHENDDVCRC